LSQAGVETSETQSPFKRSVVSGVKWTSASSFVTALLALVQTAILAHLLTPSDFGLVAAAVIVVGFGQAYADVGLSQAIIARQTTDRAVLSSLYWTNVLAGVVVFGLVLAATPLFVAFFDEPRLGSLLPVAALVFLVTPIGYQFQILLQRDLAFSRLAKIEVAAAVVGLAVAVATATGGAGAYALVWSSLARAGAMTVLLVGLGFRAWRPALHLRRADLGGYMGFGLYQMGERSINYLSANVDYLLIGRFLGVEALGFYSIAYQLVTKPLFQLNPVLTRVAFPAFAKRQDDLAALRRGYEQVIRLIGFLVIPLLTGLAVSAPAFVPFVLGDGWDESVRLVQILCLLGILKSLMNPVGSLLLARNRPDLGFNVNAGALLVTIVALSAATAWGVTAVAAANTAVTAATFAVWMLVLERVVGFGWRDYRSAIRRSAANSAVMGLVMLAAYLALRPYVGPAAMTLILTLLGASTYVALVMRFERSYLVELAWLVRPQRPADSAG
jgi:O-antigen/teichoic acid export membrane protein